MPLLYFKRSSITDLTPEPEGTGNAMAWSTDQVGVGAVSLAGDTKIYITRDIPADTEWWGALNTATIGFTPIAETSIYITRDIPADTEWWAWDATKTGL